MIKKFALLGLAAALCLWAADVWISKPYTDWNEKDIQKVVNDSPWAHTVSVEVAAGPGGRSGFEDVGAAGGGGLGGGGAAQPGIAETAGIGGGGAERGGGRTKGGGPQGGSGIEPPTPVTQSAKVTIRWQTALPVKQAFLKAKYGSEVSTSPEAKKVMERDEQYYVIQLTPLPASAARNAPDRKQTLIRQTSLNVKGKDAIRPADIQFNAGAGASEAYILFPRSASLTVDDKEVEFSSRIDRLNIKYKFKLKDMVYNNKLEL
jgi:hypothetical protein